MNFSPGTIKIVKEFIQKADLIEFQPQSIFSDIVCGSLHLTTKQENINLIDVLIEKGHAILDKELFLEGVCNDLFYVFVRVYVFLNCSNESKL